MKLPEYKLIPMSEITDEARVIAVAWVEELQTHHNHSRSHWRGGKHDKIRSLES